MNADTFLIGVYPRFQTTIKKGEDHVHQFRNIASVRRAQPLRGVFETRVG
jgi:hypothetical protein